MGNAISFSDIIGGIIDWSSSDKLKRAKVLRESAAAARTEAAEASSQSQFAYQRGDGAKAKELSNLKSAKHCEADGYNRRARDLIVSHFNADRPLSELDLHGLFVIEAKEVLLERITQCRKNSPAIHQLTVITGKGNNSRDGVAKLKPMVKQFCENEGLKCEQGSNDGVIVLVLGDPATSSFCFIM